jgi:hypothetical protein
VLKYCPDEKKIYFAGKSTSDKKGGKKNEKKEDFVFSVNGILFFPGRYT